MPLVATIYPQFSADAVRRVAAMDQLVTTAAAATQAADAMRALDEALHHAHSIKGTAAVLGCDHLAELAAEAEEMLQRAATGPDGVNEREATDLRGSLRIMLGAADAVASMDPADHAAAGWEQHAPATGRVVLHIEDAAVVVELMRALLAGRDDIDLRSAATVRESLELIRSLVASLIFLDMHLPDGSGEDVLRAMLADPATSGIPVVIVSGDDSAAEAARLRAAGAVAVIPKPFPVETVRELVDRYCGPCP